MRISVSVDDHKELSQHHLVTKSSSLVESTEDSRQVTVSRFLSSYISLSRQRERERPRRSAAHDVALLCVIPLNANCIQSRTSTLSSPHTQVLRWWRFIIFLETGHCISSERQ